MSRRGNHLHGAYYDSYPAEDILYEYHPAYITPRRALPRDAYAHATVRTSVSSTDSDDRSALLHEISKLEERIEELEEKQRAWQAMASKLFSEVRKSSPSTCLKKQMEIKVESLEDFKAGSRMLCNWINEVRPWEAVVGRVRSVPRFVIP